ncbi:hypothetical protein llap_14925 [Limosa lapponica baueri]|uniref:Zinc-finger CCCH domain-containing protein n=1 Tax=Limosa lapponica baueri TaxID=1758121 RepID=A0A2I0TLW9_LIMLA|nr:hypothetical protein llap_14925 [Limosa lapponica baueri]
METAKSRLPVEHVQEQLCSEAFAASSFHTACGDLPSLLQPDSCFSGNGKTIHTDYCSRLRTHSLDNRQGKGIRDSEAGLNDCTSSGIARLWPVELERNSQNWKKTTGLMKKVVERLQRENEDLKRATAVVFNQKLLSLEQENERLKPKYSNISCFWERQPLGCVRISCAFHHSKPRYINGLFLPPSNNAPLQQGVQEGMLHPAYPQESLRNQKNILLPIHPPLIINLNDEEDEEDDEEEENYVSNWVPKTDADIEEERAIKEMCYKSGEYYRIQYADEHQSTEPMSSPPENELLPLEATQQDLQKGKEHESYTSVTLHRIQITSEREEDYKPRGDGNKIATKINTKRDGGRSRRRVPAESIPRTDCRSFENGGIHTSDPKGKSCHQQRGQSKDDETSSMPYVRETGRKTYFNSSAPRRSAYVVYRTVTVTQEPKFSGSPGYYNAPTWRTRNPDAKTLSKFKTTIQQNQEDMEVNRKGERYIER